MVRKPATTFAIESPLMRSLTPFVEQQHLRRFCGQDSGQPAHAIVRRYSCTLFAADPFVVHLNGLRRVGLGQPVVQHLCIRIWKRESWIGVVAGRAGLSFRDAVAERHVSS